VLQAKKKEEERKDLKIDQFGRSLRANTTDG